PASIMSTPNATTIRDMLRIIHLPRSGEKGNGRAPSTLSRCATDRTGSATGPVARRFPSISGLERAALRRRGRCRVPGARSIARQLSELVGDQSEAGVDLTQRGATTGQDQQERPQRGQGEDRHGARGDAQADLEPSEVVLLDALPLLHAHPAL